MYLSLIIGKRSYNIGFLGLEKKGIVRIMNLEKAAEYQIWANDEIREMIGDLTSEEFTKNDIQDLCIHIMLAIDHNLETIILKKDVDWGEKYDELLKLSKENLMTKWRKTDERLLEYIKHKDEMMIDFPNFVKGEGIVEMTQDDYYFQYLTHTIYHRAQLMTALKKLGKKGRTTDYLNYLFIKDSV